VATSILRHKEPVGFGVPPQMWTRLSYDTRSQLSSECRYNCGHEYPTTRGASWLRRAVTNVDTSILRHEKPVIFGVPLQMWTRVSYDTSNQLASEGRDKRVKDYPPTRAASWLRSAVTNEDKDYPPTPAASWLRSAVNNVDTSILRHEQSVGFAVP
jgi:hypothetical protein